MNSENPGTEMFSVNYMIDNAEYAITDTSEVHSRLQSDADFLLQYFENTTNTPVLISIVDDATNNTSTELEIKNFSWTQRSTKLFLNSYLDRKDRFRDPKVKKKTLWTEILQIMKENGYIDLNEDLLDRRMRNMKRSYKNIKDNNKKSSTGRGRISWEYFDTFEDIFANDMTINCGSILSSMQRDNETANESQDDCEVIDLTHVSNFSNIYHNLNSCTTSSISPFQPIDPSSPSCFSPSALSASPCNVSESHSVTPTSEKSIRMSSLHRLRLKQIDIEKERIKTILELKTSIDINNGIQENNNRILENNNRIQEERNNLIRELILRNNQHGEKNT